MLDPVKPTNASVSSLFAASVNHHRLAVELAGHRGILSSCTPPAARPLPVRLPLLPRRLACSKFRRSSCTLADELGGPSRPSVGSMELAQVGVRPLPQAHLHGRVKLFPTAAGPSSFFCSLPCSAVRPRW
uniref:Uncharacterized protein n=1 Tax=Zea mays TaxID=4577 RepID=A0A804MI97_MAIZE